MMHSNASGIEIHALIVYLIVISFGVKCVNLCHIFVAPLSQWCQGTQIWHTGNDSGLKHSRSCTGAYWVLLALYPPIRTSNLNRDKRCLFVVVFISSIFQKQTITRVSAAWIPLHWFFDIISDIEIILKSLNIIMKRLEGLQVLTWLRYISPRDVEVDFKGSLFRSFHWSRLSQSL